jgi:NADH:ubiquinone oxidoreductase subunit 6 (subunit J)
MSTLERRRHAPSTPSENQSVQEQDYTPQRQVTARQLFKGLSWLDRLLSILILVAMVVGVVIGALVNHTQS